MADLLSSPVPAGRLRSLIEAGDGPVLLPGCYDALGARLIEQAGFDGVYMTGFGTAASLLGRPDVGLLGLNDMVDNARRIAAAVSLPVVADPGGDRPLMAGPSHRRPHRRPSAPGARRGPPPGRRHTTAQLEFSLVIMPITVLLSAVGAARSALAAVKAAGTPIDLEPALPSFDDFTDLIGLPEVDELQSRYV